jgi:DNA repair protein RadC
MNLQVEKYSKNTTIKMWAEDDRPREKFVLKGLIALSDAELVAIQLGSGNRQVNALELAQEILRSADGRIDLLGRMSMEELTKFKGVGTAKAINLISAIELGKRSFNSQIPDQVKITESKSVFEIFRPVLSNLVHEEFWVVFLNTSNKVIKKERISSGGLDSTIVDVRIILKRSLLLSASSIIMAHNHPSGNLKPSQADLSLTKSISKACGSINISLLDHLIISGGKYFSFTDEGLI